MATDTGITTARQIQFTAADSPHEVVASCTELYLAYGHSFFAQASYQYVSVFHQLCALRNLQLT